jgi:hypothetical protein
MSVDLTKRLEDVSLRSVSGHFFRAVIEEAAAYALEDGPAFA